MNYLRARLRRPKGRRRG